MNRDLLIYLSWYIMAFSLGTRHILSKLSLYLPQVKITSCDLLGGFTGKISHGGKTVDIIFLKQLGKAIFNVSGSENVPESFECRHYYEIDIKLAQFLARLG